MATTATANVYLDINGTRYIVDNFIDVHPGGRDLILSYIGLDASDVFNQFHGPKAKHILKSLPHETITRPLHSRCDSPTPMTQDFRALHEIICEQGLFQPNVLFYTRKFAELIALFGTSTYLLQIGYFHIAAFVMGLFFQQSGWFSHDLGHYAITRRFRRPLMILVGNLFQGFSSEWWIHKHMLHHAHPNTIDLVTGLPIDDDIDTAPMLYWSDKILHRSLQIQEARSPRSIRANLPQVVMETVHTRLLLPWQGYYIWPLLFMSKLSWDRQSFVTTIRKKNYVEMSCILTHYIVMFLHAYLLLSCAAVGARISSSIAFILEARLWGGFLIGWVFIQSHNGTNYYYRGDLDYFAAQLYTTRNVSMDRLTTWFTGGLNYQIEHHLFPQLPRHSFSKVASYVQSICKMHDVKYNVVNIFAGSVIVSRYLSFVGRTPLRLE